MSVASPNSIHPGAPTPLGRSVARKRVVVKPTQCRAARAWIGWTQGELALKAGLARKTVADFERGNRTLHYRSRETITRALESAGAEFLWADDSAGEGVRFREIRLLTV